MAVDSSGNLFVTDYVCSSVRKVTPAGTVTTFAGGGDGGTDGTGTDAGFDGPWGIAIDSADTLYVAEYDAPRIRKITSAGVVTTFAGTCAFVSHSNPALQTLFE
jgi:hypothetical protein